MTRPAGAPCWIDLLTSDTARAREFYAGVFGWTAAQASEEFGGYFMFLRDGVPVAGCMPKVAGVPGMEGPDLWGVYLSSRDAKGTIDSALAHGATLREGPTDIADLGTDAILTDPAGARIGLWQARSFPGNTVFGEPGTPAYFELITRDYEPAVGFYRDVFGWAPHVVSDAPEFRLTALRDGEETIAGIMDGSGFLPAGQAPAWLCYLKVADTDAALARITELGGSVTDAAMDTPYGRLAGASDQTGARFKLVS
jgi:predicted enzyme related to lactoylglutathione lyase